MIDAQDKLTALIRRAIEDKAGLELVTSPGKPTPRGGYPTTHLYAQEGTATLLAIEATWYPGSAAFDITGAAVEQADEAFWSARGLYRHPREITRGPLQCSLMMPYSNGTKIDQLLEVLPALIAAAHPAPAPAHAGAGQAQAQASTADSPPAGHPAGSFPRPVVPGVPAVPAGPRRGPGQAGAQASRRKP